MTKINIAINPSPGEFHVPSTFQSDNIGTQWRIDLAKHLMENSYAIDQAELVTVAAIEEFGAVQKFTKYKNRYYFMSELNGKPIIPHLDVVEVDTDIPWIINSHNGAEFVSELPNFRQVDDFGYYEEI